MSSLPGMGGGPVGPWAHLGGIPPRRPDQYAAPVGGNMLPAPQSNVVLARLVIIYGPDHGLFMYNGTPAPGNPPILSVSNNSTDPYGNMITPGLDLTGLPVLLYSGNPAAGNLVAALAGLAGTDAFGNAYLQGLTVGAPGTQQAAMVPNINQAFDITTAIAGIFEAMAQFFTNDPDQVMMSMLGSLLLGTGSAAKMASIFHSPFGTEGAAMVLEAQNDGGTDEPVITFGTVSLPDGMTMVFTPIATLTPYALLLYSASSGQTVVTATSGSGTIPIPAGVSAVKAECWGGGAGGQWASGPGGGGGEYACEPSLAVTSGGTVAYSVGAGGAGGTISNGHGLAGSNTTLTGTSVTVTAHGAPINTTSPTTGGSANTTHFSGGGCTDAGGTSDGGGGGGGSGGTSSAGNNGAAHSGQTGGAGATAVSGGGAGGKGGNGSTSSSGGTAGSAGSSPGGGGGTGGATSNAGNNGGAGAGGQVRITYTTGAPTLLGSIASAAGTDQFGNAYPAGTALPGPGDTNKYNSGPAIVVLTGSQLINSISYTPIAPSAGPALTLDLAAGTYVIDAFIYYECNQAAGTPFFEVNGSAAASGNANLTGIFYELNASATVGAAAAGNYGTPLAGPTMINLTTFAVNIKGTLSTNGGSLNIYARTSVATDTFTIETGSMLALYPTSA
jgi:hypothetical protein